jgi:hypothetical protein
MKKFFLKSTTGLVAIIAIANSAYAQRSEATFTGLKDSAIYAKKEKSAAAEKNTVSNSVEYFSTAEIKNINKRAFKNFTATFSNPENVKWFQLKDGLVAYCSVNDIRTRSIYDKKGNWRYTAQSYDETKLPKDVRTIAKRAYFDFAITGVQEIHVEDKIIYLIYMKDDTSCQTVRICDYEMDLIDSFPKNAR